MTGDEFIDERWRFHRDMMDGPRPNFLHKDCEGKHGRGWDWFLWEGDSYDSERARCGSCGSVIRGVKSPWAERALEDLKNTSAFQRREYAHQVERQRRKVKFERPGWSRTWFGGSH